MHIQKIACLTAKSGQAQQLRDALLALEALTRDEPGCKAFTFYQAISNPAAFTLLEWFVDQAAFDLHLAQPYTQAFFARQLVAGVQAFDASPGLFAST